MHSRLSGYKSSEDGTKVPDITAEFQQMSMQETNKVPEMFRLCRVQYQWSGLDLNRLVVANNVMILALSDNHVRRIDLAQPLHVDDFEVSKRTDDRVYKLFLDFAGRHLLISMASGENYYMHTSWKRPKLLTKLKNVVAECVAWLKPAMTDNAALKLSTGPFLIATRDGHIYETEIEPTEEYFRREERYCRQIFSLTGESIPVTGLYASRFEEESSHAFVVLTTVNRIFQFTGHLAERTEGAFEPLFNCQEPKYQELPPSDVPFGQLHFTLDDYQGLKGLPKAFAWSTGPGIYYGDVELDSSIPDEVQNVLKNAQLLPYPAESSPDGPDEVVVVSPVAVLMSDFHFILIYQDCVRCICKLSDEIIWECILPQDFNAHKSLRAVQDPIKNTYWLYTESMIYEVVVEDEDRYVWKLYLERKQFETALEHCKTPEQHDQVICAQGDYYFELGRYQLAATFYAQSNIPFEEVVLKFIEIRGDVIQSLVSSLPKTFANQSESTKYAAVQASIQDALKAYVLEKFRLLSPEHATQRTLLGTWIVEMYLKKLNSFERADVEKRKTQQTEFYSWLSSDGVRDALDTPTTYQLFLSHGLNEEMIFFARLIEDYDRVIMHCVQQQDWKQAIDAISKQDSLDLYYKYSPVLIEKAPYETVSLWVRHLNLNPKHLIPALLKYRIDHNPPSVRDHQGIRYLEFCIRKLNNRDPVIHNMLLSFYVAQKDNDSTLIAFLKADGRCVDLQYALRLCSQHNRLHACVVIYGALGLYEEAVELALKHDDLELARINADKPMEDEPLRKRLWLRILQSVIQDNGDIKTYVLGKTSFIVYLECSGLMYLDMCDLVRIEDVLPFFPDFVVIDDLKDHILSALEQYKVTMEELRSDMDDATKTADSIRLDLRELKKRFVKISASAKCAICAVPLLIRGFYAFPCSHNFHTDCLTAHMTKEFLSRQQQQRIVRLQEWLSKTVEALREARERSAIESTDQISHLYIPYKDSRPALDVAIRAPKPTDSFESLLQLRSRLNESLEEIIASECIYCGELMLRTIDRPFISEDEVLVAQTWAIS